MRIDDDTRGRLDRRVEALADAEAESLLDEALDEARVQVRSVLVESIAKQLLRRATLELEHRSPAHVAQPHAEQEPRPATQRRGAPTSERRMRPGGDAQAQVGATSAGTEDAGSHASSSAGPEELGCYVYGVLGGECDVELMVGIDDSHDVGVIRNDGLGAVTSRVSLSEFGEDTLHEHLNDLAWLEETARRHEYIVDRVREQTTLVPMRLCTIYRNERSVREMLAREQEFLADALRRLEGRTEWGVKLFVSPAGLKGGKEPTSSDMTERLAEAGPGETYMLRKRLENLRQSESESMLEECCELVHGDLSSLSVEAKLNPVQPAELAGRDGEMVLNGVYLVEENTSDYFTAEVSRLADEYHPRGLELELTGPWPPYNFVNDSSEVGR
jgi:Gas vesicle synthesis protein GvpL/GvpF